MAQPILTMTGISKEFPGVKALIDVDFRLFPGEVHALMGENGAGKSTLIKVLTGVYDIDQGEILLDGSPVRFGSPHEAQQGGVSTVYQEINLCPNLSVAENIFIGREPRQFGRIQWPSIRRRLRSCAGRTSMFPASARRAGANSPERTRPSSILSLRFAMTPPPRPARSGPGSQ